MEILYLYYVTTALTIPKKLEGTGQLFMITLDLLVIKTNLHPCSDLHIKECPDVSGWKERRMRMESTFVYHMLSRCLIPCLLHNGRNTKILKQ